MGANTPGAVAKAAILVGVFGCSCQPVLGVSERERSFRDLSPMEMNAHISLRQEEEFREPRMGRSFSLVLQNNTHDPIWVAWNRNPRIFIYSDGPEE